MAFDREKVLELASGQKIDSPTTPTAKDTGTVNSGDATTDGVIENNRTRIDEIEAALVELGMLNESGT